MVEVAGSGDVMVSGTAESQSVRVEGSGTYEGSGLTSRDAEVAVAGSGGARVDVSGSLGAVVEGSGSIRHLGGARVTSHVSGSGDIEED
ncbi:hypothetical protein HIR71_06165 [Cellulomonas fimi]|uniref:Putative auto-transporter adhesin head GIN domain-containing protein n=1 Tax=Cellulomonas fimi TaxID=1708 RepID=A0A7Y0LXN1_CELFI|nr:hypothetical protein [Cellulomonas fimi]